MTNDLRADIISSIVESPRGVFTFFVSAFKSLQIEHSNPDLVFIPNFVYEFWVVIAENMVIKSFAIP